MKKLFVVVFMAVMTFAIGIESVEAARFGGGRSVGSQRSVARRSAPDRSQNTTQNTTQNSAQKAAPAPAPQAPAATKPARNWLGPLAGLAAGIGLAALFSHLGLGAGMANIAMLALLVIGGIFILRMVLRRFMPNQANNTRALQTAYSSERTDFTDASTIHSPMASPYAQPMMGMGQNQPQEAIPLAIPSDFDSEGFLRVAKLNFVRLQASNDKKDLLDIREFVSSEVFAEIKMQMDERGNAPQQTDVVTLNAELLELVSEDPYDLASVEFSGMIREEINGAAQPFAEIWNLRKRKDGSRGWEVCGIQQVH